MVNDLGSKCLKAVYHNVQSLNNKLPELTLTLSRYKCNTDVVCFTEHKLISDHMYVLDFDNFMLISNFSRIACKGGGTHTFVKHHVQAKEVNYLFNLGCDKALELSAVEILDHNIMLCVYTGLLVENFMISYLNYKWLLRERKLRTND